MTDTPLRSVLKITFYATTNEALTVVADGEHRKVYLREKIKQARTTLKDLPKTQWVENTVDPSKSKTLKEGETYFSLQDHINKLLEAQVSVEEWVL